MTKKEINEQIEKLTKMLSLSIKQNGVAYQKMVWIEELSELTKAITKEQRYGLDFSTFADIVEELTDVIICLIEIINYYYIDKDTIFDIATEKIERTLERLKDPQIAHSAFIRSLAELNLKTKGRKKLEKLLQQNINNSTNSNS